MSEWRVRLRLDGGKCSARPRKVGERGPNTCYPTLCWYGEVGGSCALRVRTAELLCAVCLCCVRRSVYVRCTRLGGWVQPAATTSQPNARAKRPSSRCLRPRLGLFAALIKPLLLLLLLLAITA